MKGRTKAKRQSQRISSLWKIKAAALVKRLDKIPKLNRSVAWTASLYTDIAQNMANSE